MDRGHLVVLHASPPPDDSKTSLLITLNQLFKLSPTEGRALVELMTQVRQPDGPARRHVPRWHPGVGGTAIIDVIINRLRGKLASHDIEISTVRGLGFKLAEGAHDKIDRLLAEYNAEPSTVPFPDLTPDDCA